MIIFDYIGTNYEGNVFDASVMDIAKDAGIYSDDFIYGPERFRVDYTFLGFQKAVQEMYVKSKAIILIPGDQWNGYYEPVVYEVTLYNVIEDLEAYNNEQVLSYLDSLGIDIDSDTLLGYGEGGIWVKDFSDRTENGLSYGDTVLLTVYGHYVEADTNYVDYFPGRQFFPIGTSGDAVLYIYGEELFPVTRAVNEVVKFMDIGETIDVVSSDEYGFGDVGFAHPYTGKFIVPQTMPLHYTIQLIDTLIAN